MVASFFTSTGSIFFRDAAGVIELIVPIRLFVDFSVLANFMGLYHGFSTSALGYCS